MAPKCYIIYEYNNWRQSGLREGSYPLSNGSIPLRRIKYKNIVIIKQYTRLISLINTTSAFNSTFMYDKLIVHKGTIKGTSSVY